MADRGGAGEQGHPSPRRFFTRSTKLIGQVARPPIVERFLPGGWGPGFSPLGVSTNGLSQTRRLLHVRSQPAALTAGRVSCRLSSRDTLHRQTRFLQRRRGFASRLGRKPHSLDFAQLKRAPGLASQPYNAYRSDKTDVREWSLAPVLTAILAPGGSAKVVSLPYRLPPPAGRSAGGYERPIIGKEI